MPIAAIRTLISPSAKALADLLASKETSCMTPRAKSGFTAFCVLNGHQSSHPRITTEPLAGTTLPSAITICPPTGGGVGAREHGG